MGPLSSIFDICTFCLLWFYYHADNAGESAAAVFQTGWFLESLMTQVSRILFDDVQQSYVACRSLF